ncbi:DNA repair protein RecO [Sphingomicrobium lutaoense]|uniref:DNA repair protein RecO n=1 Tax=Sphingomicrobium lutaoense TaxID=515949 RepID=A0A839Z1E1_9SPHN|nr:DNA repair protein RecO [Sphingomicrobium lutaoense]MBB3763492.1 DNA repair protein RecO (recombination protein O) [Sphingomicrobium lutaoense]
MRLTLSAIVTALRAHGEHGGVVRLFTREEGLLAAYVRGARGKRLGPVLQPGNDVQAAISARSEQQLAQGQVELTHSRGPLFGEPLPAAAIAWSCALTATALPEGQAYPRLHDALSGLLAAIEAAPSASGWGTSLVRFELLMLAELGFGLDLSECAVTGSSEDLVAVSPRSGRAVSAGAAEPYQGRLLALPPFLRSGESFASWEDVLAGLALSGHFLERDLLTDRAANILPARERLITRLRGAAGLA